MEGSSSSSWSQRRDRAVAFLTRPTRVPLVVWAVSGGVLILSFVRSSLSVAAVIGITLLGVASLLVGVNYLFRIMEQRHHRQVVDSEAQAESTAAALPAGKALLFILRNQQFPLAFVIFLVATSFGALAYEFISTVWE